MDEAQAFPHVIQVIQHLKAKGHTLAIVSHKTKYPYLGKQYDLHAAARGWIEKYLCENSSPLILSENIFFELIKEAKLARIAQFNCDIFIDDLPEILLAPNFPLTTQGFLFDPEGQHLTMQLANIKMISSWLALCNL